MHHVSPLREEVVEKAMASAAGRQIISHCIREPLAVKDISDRTRLPLASVYRRVRHLVDDEILVVERSAMTPDGKPYDLYRSRLRMGKIEVSAGKVQVTWEANVSLEDRLLNMWGHLRG